MSSNHKNKRINKKNHKPKDKNPKLAPPEEDELDDITKGDPVLKNLSDFVTAIVPTYVSKPIYTGGRILAGQDKIYASCNNSIAIYSVKEQTVVQKIKHVNF